ncbi:MAG TPA: PKD domain-containing protein [Pyrinomonadaceae bacterium]|nr:PKD domain-containing protein [Pyrinomonadaceae bacterium]
MSRKSLWLFFVLALIATGLVLQPATNAKKKKKKQNYPASSGPPTLSLSVEPRTIKLCEGVAPVQLNAIAKSADGAPLRYRWRVNGGQVRGDGPNPTWDLTGLQPGTYQANVEVDDGKDINCAAFSTVPIIVIECPPVPVPPACPTVNISCPESVKEGETVRFATTVTGGRPAPGMTPSYDWTVNCGKIVSGQGTPTITVDTTGCSGQTIQANVNLTGYGVPCPATCSVAIPIMNKPRKFDEYYDIARNDEKARLDNYAIQLQQEPGSQGYVFVYPSRKAGPSAAQARAQRIIDYLVTTRGIDSHRLVVTMGPARDEWLTELWIVPEGVQPPQPRR